MTDAEIKKRAWRLVDDWNLASMELDDCEIRLSLRERIAAAMREAAAEARLEEAQNMWSLRCIGAVLGDEAMQERIVELEAAVKSAKP